MLKALITEGIDNSGLEYLLANNITVYTLNDQYDSKEIDIIIVRSRYVVDKVFFQDYSNIKVVAKLGTGLDNIDTVYCKTNNIHVINAPGVNSNSTAEFAIGLVYLIVKNMLIISNKVKEKDFRRNLYYGRELSSLNVGIIGYGSIGKLIEKKLSSQVKSIMVADSKLTSDNGKLSTFLDNSNIIILALSLSGNKEFVNKEFLMKCKKNAILINIARGALVNEKEMFEFLQVNKDFIYCTDVLIDEPDYELNSKEQNYTNNLFSLSNFIYTPHIAGMTKESQENLSLEISNKIIKVVK